MDGSTKGFFASKTIWGGLVIIVVQVLTMLGLDPAAIADTGEWLTNLITLAAAGFTIYGRLSAKTKIIPPQNVPPGVGGFSGTDYCLALFGLGLALAVTGCGPTAPYVAADRLTHDAIAPEYRLYVAADGSLTAEEKARRDRTLESWDLRVRTAEAEGSGGR